MRGGNRSRMPSPSRHNARNWPFRSEEIRTLAADMMQEEPKAIMLGIADWRQMRGR